MQRFAIGFRVDRDSGYAQLLARAIDAERDLATVGDQNFSKHASWPGNFEERLAVLDRSAVLNQNREKTTGAS